MEQYCGIDIIMILICNSGLVCLLYKKQNLAYLCEEMGTHPESDIPASQTRVSGVYIAIQLAVFFDVSHMSVVVVVVVVVVVAAAAIQLVCPEIEAFLVAILDQIISISSYIKYIQHSENVTCDKETMQHRIFDFKILALTAHEITLDNVA